MTTVRRAAPRRRERGQLPERRPSPSKGSVYVHDDTVRIVVLGKPAPQGSKVAVAGRVVEDNPRTKGWRQVIAEVCSTYLPAGWEPLDGPLEVWMTFYFDPPRGAQRGDRPTTRSTYDGDKLQRAIDDGLTQGGVIVDDARIVDWRGSKRYVWPDEGEARAEVIVMPSTG